MSYDRVDFFGKAMLGLSTLMAIAMGISFINGWTAAGLGFLIGEVVAGVLAVLAARELRRQMRVHNLTIVTEKLDRAIRDHDRATT
jgi:urea transporter